MSDLPRYRWDQSYEWNYQHVPDPVLDEPVPEMSGSWDFCGLPVDSPLGLPAGPLLNGRWCLYYASLGFDVLTYKTVRRRRRDCYPLPNLQPVDSSPLDGSTDEVQARDEMGGSWAVSFGMPSRDPSEWREDVRWTRDRLGTGKLLVVSTVATVEPGWSIEQLGDDYAQCAAWAIESGADCVETNFSCPNVVTCDGQLYQECEQASQVARQVRAAVGDAPYLVKIGHVPSRADAQRLVAAVGEHVDGLAMTNSIATTVRGANGLMFDGGRRGICGAAILDESLRQVERFRDAIERQGAAVDIVGVGGIGEADHVKRFLSAGAVATHLATAAMLDPAIARRIRREWSALAVKGAVKG